MITEAPQPWLEGSKEGNRQWPQTILGIGLCLGSAMMVTYKRTWHDWNEISTSPLNKEQLRDTGEAVTRMHRNLGIRIAYHRLAQNDELPLSDQVLQILWRNEKYAIAAAAMCFISTATGGKFPLPSIYYNQEVDEFGFQIQVMQGIEKPQLDQIQDFFQNHIQEREIFTQLLQAGRRAVLNNKDLSKEYIYLAGKKTRGELEANPQLANLKVRYVQMLQDEVYQEMSQEFHGSLPDSILWAVINSLSPTIPQRYT